jgi:hypothetical protein
VTGGTPSKFGLNRREKSPRFWALVFVGLNMAAAATRFYSTEDQAKSQMMRNPGNLWNWGGTFFALLWYNGNWQLCSTGLMAGTGGAGFRGVVDIDGLIGRDF